MTTTEFLNPPAPINSRLTQAQIENKIALAEDCEIFSAITFTTQDEKRFWEIVNADIVFVNAADGGCFIMKVDDWDEGRGLVYLNLVKYAS